MLLGLSGRVKEVIIVEKVMFDLTVAKVLPSKLCSVRSG